MALVTLCMIGLLTCCCWWHSRLLDYWPVQDASAEARSHAANRGYRMEGFFGDFTREPDAVGGCAVRIEFHDFSHDPPRRKVTVYLRRAWRLSGWEVTETSVEDIPDAPRTR